MQGKKRERKKERVSCNSYHHRSAVSQQSDSSSSLVGERSVRCRSFLLLYWVALLYINSSSKNLPKKMGNLWSCSPDCCPVAMAVVSVDGLMFQRCWDKKTTVSYTCLKTSPRCTILVYDWILWQELYSFRRFILWDQGCCEVLWLTISTICTMMCLKSHFRNRMNPS